MLPSTASVMRVLAVTLLFALGCSDDDDPVPTPAAPDPGLVSVVVRSNDSGEAVSIGAAVVRCTNADIDVNQTEEANGRLALFHIQNEDADADVTRFLAVEVDEDAEDGIIGQIYVDDRKALKNATFVIESLCSGQNARLDTGGYWIEIIQL